MLCEPLNILLLLNLEICRRFGDYGPTVYYRGKIACFVLDAVLPPHTLFLCDQLIYSPGEQVKIERTVGKAGSLGATTQIERASLCLWRNKLTKEQSDKAHSIMPLHYVS